MILAHLQLFFIQREHEFQSQVARINMIQAHLDASEAAKLKAEEKKDEIEIVNEELVRDVARLKRNIKSLESKYKSIVCTNHRSIVT